MAEAKECGVDLRPFGITKSKPFWAGGDDAEDQKEFLFEGRRQAD